MKNKHSLTVKVASLLFFAWGMLWAPVAKAFVLIGPLDATEQTINAVNVNLTDDLGGPKELKTFFRWNTPDLTYSFDTSFVKYMGLEGMDAVHNVYGIMNDFFSNGDYDGVSRMDLVQHGFASNYNSTWINTTAQNNQVIDLKSIALGMIVNHIGLGNPHRYAYIIRGIVPNPTGTQWNFNVRLRNYDPLSWQPTDRINSVQYSYRLIHDAAPILGGVIVAPTFADMEEYTSDTSGNAWTAVSGIIDSFYGNTAIYWTTQPTLFSFGVYYDGDNAMGGRNEPRHALTYDDAGGLKYLYRTNNYVWEDLPATTVLVTPAQFLPDNEAVKWAPVGLNGITSFTGPNTGLRLSGRGFFPRQSMGAVVPVVPQFSSSAQFRGTPINGNPNAPLNFVGQALRGGIDKMRFHYRPFDSLLGVTFVPTNFFWTDTFVSTNGNSIFGLSSTTPYSTVESGVPLQLKFFSQQVGRNVAAPDFIYVVDDLGVSADGVPIAWNRSDAAAGWTDNAALNAGSVALATPVVGPGVIEPGQTIVYTFSRLLDGYEVLWSGESSVVGNTVPYSLWGHIKGPGAADVVTFPNTNVIWRLENAIRPETSVPSITYVSDTGGAGPIEANSLTRTQETLSIVGNNLAGAQAIELVKGNLVLQVILPVDKFIVSDQRIDIPPGIITDAAEALVDVQVRVWNSVGASTVSAQKFGVRTGRAVVTSTSRDGFVFDRGQALTLTGYGFKSKQVIGADGGATLTHFRVEAANGTVEQPASGISTATTFEVISDTQATLRVSQITSIADGANRRVLVAREATAATLSSTNGVPLIAAITATPTITASTGLVRVNNDSTTTVIVNATPLQRDSNHRILGTALNTAVAIEIIGEDSTSFNPPVMVLLPDPGVTVADDGTTIDFSANVFTSSGADGITSATTRRKLKVYNAVGNGLYGSTAADAFSVNIQPVVNAVGAFLGANAFNREKTTGDDIVIFGSGLKAAATIEIVDEAVASLGATLITLPAPGVTVTDTQITIDTQTMQFGSGGDSTTSLTYRRFNVTSARTAATTPATQKFLVGIPPTYTSLSGTSLALVPHNVRDISAGTFIFTGTGLAAATKIEYVDFNGNTIAGLPALDTSNGATFTSTTATITAVLGSIPGIALFTHLVDSVTTVNAGVDGQRRLRVTTPFGVMTSTVGDAFTVSATATLGATVDATFAGGGYNGGTDTYDVSDGNLIINGTNFRGVTTIQFRTSAGAAVAGAADITIDPAAPPAGVTVNAAGTQITITSATIPATWADGSSRTIILIGPQVAQTVTSQAITAQQ